MDDIEFILTNLKLNRERLGFRKLDGRTIGFLKMHIYNNDTITTRPTRQGPPIIYLFPTDRSDNRPETGSGCVRVSKTNLEILAYAEKLAIRPWKMKNSLARCKTGDRVN